MQRHFLARRSALVVGLAAFLWPALAHAADLGQVVLAQSRGGGGAMDGAIRGGIIGGIVGAIVGGIAYAFKKKSGGK